MFLTSAESDDQLKSQIIDDWSDFFVAMQWENNFDTLEGKA